MQQLTNQKQILYWCACSQPDIFFLVFGIVKILFTVTMSSYFEDLWDCAFLVFGMKF